MDGEITPVRASSYFSQDMREPYVIRILVTV